MAALVSEDNRHSSAGGDSGTSHVFRYRGSGDVPEDVKEVVVEDGVTTIGDEVFSGCSSLASISLPSTLTTIGDGVFSDCSSLTSVTLPSTLTSMGDQVFSGCSSLASITLPSTLTTMGDNVFSDCSSLTSVTLPSALTSMGNEVFGWCSSLTSVTLPSTLTTIGDRVFTGCSSLISVTLPSTLTDMGDNVFDGCKSLTTITLPSTLTTTTIGDGLFRGCTLLASVTIHAQITTIDSYSFFQNQSLESITLPPSLTTIGDFAFCGCKSLESIELPSSVTSLGDGVFAGCESLSFINKLQSTTSTGRGVFYGCKKLPDYRTLVDEAKQISIPIDDGPGPQHGFKGKVLSGYGPERCGITFAQIQQMKDHTSYDDKKYLMRDYVRDIVKPLTDGTGLSYALLQNKALPLTAKVMVSHAWDESIREFVEAIERSKEKGPFWVCALSIYQNDDPDKGPTIGDQLGSDPEFGPFATVLKEVKEQGLMLAVLTSGCDIYTRLWCVYEIFFAIRQGVKVKLAPHISNYDLSWGKTGNDICVNEAIKRVNSKTARCGAPGTPQNEDEIAIRNTINDSNGGFELVNKTVERIRLIHLLSYPVGDIEAYKAPAIDNIKQAIEHILPCFADEGQLKTFDEFLEEELSARPGFERVPRVQRGSRDHDYYIRNKANGNENEKLDVFNMWSESILKVIKP